MQSTKQEADFDFGLYMNSSAEQQHRIKFNLALMKKSANSIVVIKGTGQSLCRPGPYAQPSGRLSLSSFRLELPQFLTDPVRELLLYQLKLSSSCIPRVDLHPYAAALTNPSSPPEA